jgi:hypothetical protein
MKKAISHDKKRGRPATGERPAISARVSKEVFTAVEVSAKKRNLSRSEAAREIIELGLRVKK